MSYRTKHFINILNEIPKNAKIKSHILMLKAGFIKEVSSGIYTLLPPMVKILNKIENIIRNGMDEIGFQEILMPGFVPKSFLSKSGRDNIFKDNIFTIKTRKQQELFLGATHEETVSELIASINLTYKDLPITLYQIQNKFRDELRPRFGLIRTYEFKMKDAYSFHIDEESLNNCYDMVKEKYIKIFSYIGLNDVKIISADSGNMGGNISEEFMIINEHGEDTVVECPNKECNYIANQEKAVSISNTTKEISKRNSNTSVPNLNVPQLIETKISPSAKSFNIKSYFYNNIKNSDFVLTIKQLERHIFVNTLIYKYTIKDITKYIFIMIEYSDSINETKLCKILQHGTNIELANQDDIKSLGLYTNFIGGYKIPQDILDKHNIEIYIDNSIIDAQYIIIGGNKENYHYAYINIGRDIIDYKAYDIRNVNQDDLCIKCESGLELNNAIELGHIFKLDKTYSTKHNIKIKSKDNKTITPYMGCYGIGLNRIIISLIEKYSILNLKLNINEIGIPYHLTPYKVAIIVAGKVSINEVLENLDFKTKISDRLFNINHRSTIFDTNNKVNLKKRIEKYKLLSTNVIFIIGNSYIKDGSVTVLNKELQNKNKSENKTLYNEMKLNKQQSKEMLKYFIGCSNNNHLGSIIYDIEPPKAIENILNNNYNNNIQTTDNEISRFFPLV